MLASLNGTSRLSQLLWLIMVSGSAIPNYTVAKSEG